MNAPDSLPKIGITSVSHTFAHRQGITIALQDIDLSIRDGEVVSIVGPSGCGKSTLLNMIAGFIIPTTGRITINDREVTGPGPDRGVVFQEYALFRWLSVQENVEFGPRMRGIPALQRREIADHYIKLVGLSKFKNRYPYELSGGMQQRVALARIFANESDILLMDEPFASLDAQTRDVMQEELVKLWSKTHKTIFFITHSVDEAVFISTRVVVMTARPGRTKKDFAIHLPADRFNFQTRTAPEFLAARAEILDIVRAETAKQLDEE